MAKAHRVKGIDCKDPAGVAIRLVLIERFAEMSGLRQEALNWEDAEGVHSMRVASRRLRSAVRDFMPYINKRGLAPTLKQIKTIADALGEVRDQDVAIPALETLASKAPAKVAEALKDVIAKRKEARLDARKELEKILVK